MVQTFDACVIESNPQAERNNANTKEFPALDESAEKMEGIMRFCLAWGTNFSKLMEFRRHKKRQKTGKVRYGQDRFPMYQHC